MSGSVRVQEVVELIGPQLVSAACATCQVTRSDPGALEWAELHARDDGHRTDASYTVELGYLRRTRQMEVDET